MRVALYKLVLAAAFIATLTVYWSGLSGGWLFDDYPNIVDNQGVQPSHADLATLVNAALSSPSSEFKRPLASLTFALNYLVGGLHPFGWKLTNLAIHLLNGWLVFLLARLLLDTNDKRGATSGFARDAQRTGMIAALIAATWMLLPINLTGVLYVVQRMESMANVFVLLGLIGYVTNRRRMLGITSISGAASPPPSNIVGLARCAAWIIVPTAIGILAKETAVMLPCYAMLIEWTLFRFDTPAGTHDRRLLTMFIVVLVLPMILGLTWLMPGLLNPESWANRNFTLGTRLLSETRIVVDYIGWTFLPMPHELSFYHDNFRISTGLFSPWTTGISTLVLVGLATTVAWLRTRQPLVSLGIALFMACHLLTGTILPLELVYEHRNYFASFGLMLAAVPLLAALTPTSMPTVLVLPRRVLLGGLLLLWAGETTLTATAWGNPLQLAETLTARAPDSPRAQYELGRTYIIYSGYDPSSSYIRLAYAALERAAALPGSSILPEQALIFMNSRMDLPVKDAWWNSLITKLKARKPGVQDESSLGALTQCARAHRCHLSISRMTEAYLSALSHPSPSARLLAMYGDYAWNILGDYELGLRMIDAAVAGAPSEPAYRITQIRMLAVLDHRNEAYQALDQLQQLDTGGRLDNDLHALRSTLAHLPQH